MTTEQPTTRRRRAEVVPAPEGGDPWKLAPESQRVNGAGIDAPPGTVPGDPGTDEQAADEAAEAKPARRGRSAALATSAQLAKEIDKSTREAGLVTSAQAVRGDANPFGALPGPGPGYDRITERVFNLPDPDAEYEDLEQALVLGTRTYESVSEALDRAEDNARRAHRLYVNARVDAERFNIDADVIESAMRTQAVGELQREKDAGVRTKTITETDTASKVAAMFPDEYRDLAERKVKSRKMVEHMEVFAKLWSSRCSSLSKMLESKR
jgi:hypothetical protein